MSTDFDQQILSQHEKEEEDKPEDTTDVSKAPFTDYSSAAREKISNYQEALEIDKDDLDTALMQQANIYHEICMEHAYAQSMKDACSENLKTVDAHLNIDVRKVFEQAGERVTEAKIASEVQLAAQHIKAAEEYRDAYLAANLWGVMKDSFHQRAYMLREMAGLYATGYWIGDSSHKETSKSLRGRVSGVAKNSLDREVERNTTRRTRSGV